MTNTSIEASLNPIYIKHPVRISTEDSESKEKVRSIRKQSSHDNLSSDARSKQHRLNRRHPR